MTVFLLSAAVGRREPLQQHALHGERRRPRGELGKSPAADRRLRVVAAAHQPLDARVAAGSTPQRVARRLQPLADEAAAAAL